MIVWLASYPKSGNTFLRSLLSTYFFSDDGIFNFELLKNISQFPDKVFFKGLNVDFNNNIDIAKNCIIAQSRLNQGPNTVQFFKTHSSFYNIGGYNFTNLSNSLGVIYIVRDPRNIITSFANHYSISLLDAKDLMTNDNWVIGKKEMKTFVSSWNFNYHSWKKFNDKFLLIRYEDLANKTESVFLEIIRFLEKILNTKYNIDNEKLSKTLETTKFDVLKNLEQEEGFYESVLDPKTKKKKKFFLLGKKNDWRKILDKEIKKKIEERFKKEMIQLGYL